MKYELGFIAKEYKHGWSVWLDRDNKKFMIGSAIKTEQEVLELINGIKLKEMEKYEPNETIEELKKESDHWKRKYIELIERLRAIQDIKDFKL